MFIVLSILTAIAFFVTFVQLLNSKPTSKKVLIPIVLVTTFAFMILIALDFYLEIQLSHLTPKEALTSSESSSKKGKSRFKTGYLIIYGEINFLNDYSSNFIHLQLACVSSQVSFISHLRIWRIFCKIKATKTVKLKSLSVTSREFVKIYLCLARSSDNQL